ncbi:hypothetical protein Bccel_3808 [Pseudobacteroides cellulosolvens ATCC 35603 = DSM 2933]|uniref:Uncharacterized protein n=1 Tax=Pseudobacteroides cellulosolvens ATCC 35603 = DSM 2933 TaxID=398512 RepID=A0A0L6JS19_9FIRM|nr:hypothetical protein Bccel_3808 [Pseudobacteroides cellulosolvens ATCC 35603 = DSM 2933]
MEQVCEKWIRKFAIILMEKKGRQILLLKNYKMKIIIIILFL